jgi:hypothetical protein
MTKKTRKAAKPSKPARPTKRAKAAKQAKAAQAAPAKKVTPVKPAGKVYVVFGTDEYTKPRAARFSAEDTELLAKAAEALRLRLVEVEAGNEELAEVAARLPAGRLHATGKRLVPYIKGGLYSELLSAAMGELRPQQNRSPSLRTCRAAGMTWRRAISSSQERRSSSAGGRRS